METLILAALLGNAVAWCFDPIQDLKLHLNWREGNRVQRFIRKLTNCPSCLAWWSAFPIGYFVMGEGWKTILWAVCAHTLAALLEKLK